MSDPQYPYGQQPYGGQPQYGQPPYGQPQYGQSPYGVHPPQMGGPPGPPPMMSPPSSIRRAKWAMWAGAFFTMLLTPALGLDLRVVDTTEWDDLVRETGDIMDPEVVFLFMMGTVLLVSLVMALLWVLIAHYSAKGAEWARITGSVLFVLWLLIIVCGLPGATLDFALLVNVLTVLAGIAAVLFLWLPDSSAWFRQRGTTWMG